MTAAFLVVGTLALAQVGPVPVPAPPPTYAPVVTGLPRFGAPAVTDPVPAVPGVLTGKSWSYIPVGTQAPQSPSGKGSSQQTDGSGSPEKNGKNGAEKNAKGSADEAKDGKNAKEEEPYVPGFFRNFCKAYCDEFFPKKKSGNGDSQEPETPPYRRALPEPWSSPPFPGHEYQGYPLIGVPPSTDTYPFMKGVYATECGDAVKASRIKFDGWVTASGNWSTATNTNTPTSYWIVPNRYELDQMLFRLQREVDTVQTDHLDWGFRSVVVYGMDYRYTTAGGWFSSQLLKNNLLYGWDPAEQYFDLYIPWIGQGAVIRVGRWIACPDIETQWAPDNYLGSHSILFTYDTYTQTGVMWTQRLTEQWSVQAAIHAGTDMAPWYPGAVATGAFGFRWVAKDNNDAAYVWLNAINNAEFRHFEQYGQPLGHDNFNYVVGTWEHRFSKDVHTKTEAYFMWEKDAEVGGTPSAGPVKSFGGGGGDGTLIPGWSKAYGVLNYTMFAFTKNDYITVRNEWWRDETGFRSGFAGNYTSHTIGLSHNFNALFQIRPEIGYYRNWTQPAFDGGSSRGLWLYGFDMTLRF
jgi:hypothetical protein